MPEETNVAQDNTAATNEAVETTTQTTETTETTQSTAQATEQKTEQTERKTEQPADLLAEYKPTLPDGVEIDKAAYDLAMPVFKELGLTPEQADKLTGLYTQLQREFGPRILEDINNQCQTNYDDVMKEIKADKQLGKNFEQNTGHVNAMLEKYGATGEQLHTALTAMAGFDQKSVKPFFVALTKIAQDWADPTTILGNSKPNGGPKTAAEVLYPNQK
jgi:hypothetical protein